jgi:tetratricopeptide (TPR) repeat protein
MSQVSKEKSIPSQLPVMEPVHEPSFGDRLLESVKPHANLIMLSIAALFLLFIVVAFMIQTRQSVAEGEWLSFNAQVTNLELTGNTSGMKELAEDYPDGKAGLWGLQLAGNFELRQGLQKLGSKRSEGLKEIEKARNTLKRVVDAPADKKSTLLQVRSTYSLAYAYESLGDFDNAKSLYQKLVDQAPDSGFGQAAERGLKRCSDPAFAEIYERFQKWEDPFAIAPDAPTAQKPDISFPEIPNPSTSQKSDPAKSDPAKSDPAKSDSTTPDPAKSDLTISDSAKASAAASQPAQPANDQPADKNGPDGNPPKAENGTTGSQSDSKQGESGNESADVGDDQN